MKRERGPLWTGALGSASRWSAETGVLARDVGGALDGAHEALPQTPPGGRPPETPKILLDTGQPSHGSRDRKGAVGLANLKFLLPTPNCVAHRNVQTVAMSKLRGLPILR